MLVCSSIHPPLLGHLGDLDHGELHAVVVEEVLPPLALLRERLDAHEAAVAQLDVLGQHVALHVGVVVGLVLALGARPLVLVRLLDVVVGVFGLAAAAAATAAAAASWKEGQREGEIRKESGGSDREGGPGVRGSSMKPLIKDDSLCLL